MKRLYVLVEGQTEESFVKMLLVPHLARFSLYPIPVLLETKRGPDGGKYKGGVSSYAKIKRDVQRLLKDRNAVAVTTMLDFYGRPDDFPQPKQALPSNCFAQVQACEQSFAEDIGNRRFIPYLMLHEYEAMLFSAPPTIAAKVPCDVPEVATSARLQAIRNQFSGPEEINDDPKTAPSKRLRAIFGQAYRKPLHGVTIADAIGLPKIRQECPHFHNWLTWLEAC